MIPLDDPADVLPPRQHYAREVRDHSVLLPTPPSATRPDVEMGTFALFSLASRRPGSVGFDRRVEQNRP